MRHAVKYIYDANPFYIHLKKHFCPQCNTKLKLSYIRKIINSKSPEAKKYNFSIGDTYLVGNVEFRTRCFYCPKCNRNISILDIKKFERRMKNK